MNPMKDKLPLFFGEKVHHRQYEGQVPVIFLKESPS